jgi:hypothetical protein
MESSLIRGISSCAEHDQNESLKQWPIEAMERNVEARCDEGLKRGPLDLAL